MSESDTGVIIVDSSSFDFSFQGFWDNTSGATRASVWNWPYLNSTRDARDWLGNFTFTFQGSGVTFVGGSPLTSPSFLPRSTITIDPDSPQALTVLVNGTDEPYPGPWYNTHNLAYGTHRILMAHCYQLTLDYALVIVGPDTDLEGKTMFVDDSDAQIEYQGSGWEITNNLAFDSHNRQWLTPAQNTTHAATRVGDSFTFSFLGTSATIYGFFAWGNVSSLAVQFELDGNVTSETYHIQEVNWIIPEWYVNFPFISYDNLPAGDHQLKVTVTEISNTTLRLDYITYTPAFSTLTSKNTTSTGNSSTIIFTPAPVANSDSDGQHLEFKVVVGSVLGGLALLAFAVGCLVWWHRRLNSGKSVGNQLDASNNKEDHVTRGIVPFPPEKVEAAASAPPVIIDRVQNSATAIPYPQEKIPNLIPSSPETTARPVHDQVQTAMIPTATPYPQEKLPRIIHPPQEDATAQGSTQHAAVSRNKTRAAILVADPSASNSLSQPTPPSQAQLPVLTPLRRQNLSPSQAPASDGALPPSYASAWSE
ncbi:hypothetical protein BJ165DRAFT_1404242 [Panaeolus papilionaceus]|nr:hypothetical protein BJ165DRAFT_1404242 [Panaeolus papilionaceus]